jgi:hypothetical protein
LSLLIQASPPKIEVTDTSGHLVLDTSKSLFHVTDTLSGSVALSAWSNPPHNGGTDITIGSCHVGSTFVRGAVRATYTGTAIGMFPTSGWFVLGSTFVQIQNLQGTRFYSFVAAAGTVKLLDRVYIHSITNEFGQVLSGLGSVTLQYYLLVGRFSP